MKKNYLLKVLFALSLFVIFVQFTSAQKKKILYVGADEVLGSNRTCDKEMIDSLLAWGYDTIYLGHATYDAKGAGSGVHTGIDGVFFGESCGSNSLTPYGPMGDNFPVPAIALEAAAFGISDERWSLFKEESTPGAGDGGSIIVHTGEVADSTDNMIKISDNKHYITEIYEKDYILKWSNSTSYALVPYIQGIKVSNKILAVPVAPVTQPTNGETVSAMSMIESKLPKVKIFWFTNTHSLLNGNMGTSEFYQLIKRAAEYTYDNMPSAIEENIIERIDFVAYPNPSAGNVFIRFYAPKPANAQVVLYDLTGKQIDVLLENSVSMGYNFLTLERDNYVSGVYVIKLTIGENVTYTKVLLQ
jgi:hypothetical protein